MVHRCRFSSKSEILRLSGKIRKIKDLTDRREREIRAPFPAAEIFDLSWPFQCRFRSEGERSFLLDRVRKYVFNQRRGSFKLPRKFRDFQSEVSRFTKSKLREMLYKVKPSITAECRALRTTFDLANRVLTRSLWRFSGSIAEDCARRVDTHRLPSRDWPRSSRSLWPSSPSVSELIVMSRSGKVPSGMWKPRRIVNDCPTVRDLSNDLSLATRIVRLNVVGIRSTVSVPRKFLPWFRYRHEFLILTVRYHLPAGLVRFLIAQWKVSPFNLWLNANCRLKYYLRLTRPTGTACEATVRQPTGVVTRVGLTVEGGKASPSLQGWLNSRPCKHPRLTSLS